MESDANEVAKDAFANWQSSEYVVDMLAMGGLHPNDFRSNFIAAVEEAIENATEN